MTTEGFVSQMPEYLAVGKTIIATNVSDCDIMLSDGAGILIEPNDLPSLADSLAQAIRNKSAQHEYARRARKKACEFSWEKNRNRLMSIYEALAASYAKLNAKNP